MISRLSNSDSNTQLTSNETTNRITTSNSKSSVTAPNVLSDQNENSSSTAVDIEQQKLSAEKVQKITDSLNKLLETTSTKLRYQFHEKLDKYYVTLVDSKTDEVVREIPDKKLMDIYAAMLDFVGVFVDEKI